MAKKEFGQTPSNLFGRCPHFVVNVNQTNAMTKFLAPLFVALIALLSACSTPSVDPIDTAQSAKLRQANQWLTGQTRWVVGTATQNGNVYYQRGVQKPGEVDMEVEWLRFLPDGRFEVQMVGEANPNALFYKIDGTTNELIVSPTADFKTPLNWNTKIDNIRETSVDLFIREGSDDLSILTLVPQE